MSIILREYHQTTLDDGFNVRRIGSLNEPQKAVTLNGDFVSTENDYVVLPDNYEIPYTYVDRLSWSFLKLSVIGDGYLDGWYLVDTPASDTDRNPSGLHPRWHAFGINCFWPAHIDPQVRNNPTLATDIGDSGGGLPSAMFADDTVNGYVYKVVVKNRGTSSVRFSRILVN